MAYDPTKPANGAPILSTELRSQFSGLMDEIQLRALSVDVADSIVANSAGPVNDVAALALTASNPPTQAQVQAIVDKVNEMLGHLQRAV